MSDHRSIFEQSYRCYPVAFIGKSHLEKGDKIVMPPSALDRLAHLQIDYPMLFELANPAAGRISHCGVLEFIADEGLIYLPYWMMENMLLQEGEIVQVKSASLSKGTYVKLQPHTKDFLDLSNPKAVLETTLRNYSCLTNGDTIMVDYNKKRYYINVVETKPSSAISIIETDCEVDFAPPLDYKEPEKPQPSTPSKKTSPEVEEEPAKKKSKFNAFTGLARRLDGKPSEQPVAPDSSPVLEQHQPMAANRTNDIASPDTSRQCHGKLVFGSNTAQSPLGPSKAMPKESKQESSQKVKSRESNQEQLQKEETKFRAFTGKKYLLKD